MDDPRTSNSPPSGSQDFARSLEGGRRRAAELLSAQRARLDAFEQTLGEQIERIGEELSHDQAITAARGVELDRESEKLARLKEELEHNEREWRQAQDLANRRQRSLAAQLTKRQEELEAREKTLEAAEAAARETRRTIAAGQEELQAQRAELAAGRDRVQERLAALEREREQLATAQDELKAQRRRIAREFQARHAEHLARLDERRRDLQKLTERQHTDLEERLEKLTAERDQLTRKVSELADQLAQRDEALELLAEREERLKRELENLHSDHDKLTQELAVSESVDRSESRELAELRADREALLQRLAKAEKNGKSSGASDVNKDDLQRRFEMAVEDVRDLKRQNAELESKLARAGGGGGGSPATGKLDWEAQKRRLLASLEADFDPRDANRAEERLTIEGAIRITDAVVAEKEREIAELKQMLEMQSASQGPGAAAIAGVLDQDEVIQQERENLRQLQAQVQEKLRKAEIDISVERAKLARDRAELEEKLAAMEVRQADEPPANAAPGGLDKGGKPRGRWLTRLGLKEE